MGLKPTDGALMFAEGLKTGMSGFPSVSKSIDGISLNFPTASFTDAIRICQIACSFSNLISVFVG